MRSLIILEVEHGETTDILEYVIESVRTAIENVSLYTALKDYTVRVDLPACFVLDSGNTN